jgi:polar amino acid transport system ATP-binding protein
MIELQHLEKAYENVTPLQDVNAEIRKGDVISVIGPSGTGKSTLLRCINMLDPPTKGKVLVDGVDLTDPRTDLRQMRKKMGMVFQSFNLFSHKMVIENVMMAPVDLLGVSRQEAFDEGVRYLKMVGLGEKLYAYPDELSGGQKQRVAIARCLAMKPEIILFDEPTSALDPTMVGEVQGVIRKLADEGLTMMVVTHDMKFSREIANRVFYMDQGVIYEDGTPEQVFENPRRERTRAFVKRLRTLEYQIQSADFDIYELNAQISAFGRDHFLTGRQVNSTQLMVEELVLNSLI